MLVLLAGCNGSDDSATPEGSRSSVTTSQPTPAESIPAESTTTATDRPPQPDAEEQARLDAALIKAAWANDVDRARHLITMGADVNAQDDTEQSAYLISTSEGYLRLLDLVLENGADVRALDSFDGTGLIRAADRGHDDIVGRLLQTKIRVDHVNNLGWTALHEAIILGDGSQRYLDTVRALVAGGSDVTIAPRGDGIAPVQHARSRGYDDIADLVQAAERAEPADPDRALLDAARSGDADRAALAIRAGAGLETRDDRDRTPLLLASTFDRVEVARLLVGLGADPDALDDQHDTAWLVTGVTGSVAMLETLLPADPDLTIENRFGGISVIPASERGHVAYVRRVVRTDIDVNHINDLGWTAMLEAVILGDGSRPYQQIVQILLDAGADPSIADKDGVTALEHAQQAGYAEIARLVVASTRR